VTSVSSLLGQVSTLLTLVDRNTSTLKTLEIGTCTYQNEAVSPIGTLTKLSDGNWFTHFLDSSEQSLLCVLLFNDVVPRAGGTFICEDGLMHIIKW